MTKALFFLSRHWRVPIALAAFALLAAVPFLRPSAQGAGVEDSPPRQVIILTATDIQSLGTPTWQAFSDHFGLDGEMIRRSIEATQNDSQREQIVLSRQRSEQFMTDRMDSAEGHAILVLSKSP